MQIERRPQNPLPSIPLSAPSGEEVVEAAESAAAGTETPLGRLEQATETLIQAVQKLHDAFSDISGLLSREQVAASTASAQGGDPVDRLIDYTARNEGGGNYSAWNPNDNGAGVSFGLIQFNQKRGSLPTLMQRMHDKDPAKFDQIFGPHAQN